MTTDKQIPSSTNDSAKKPLNFLEQQIHQDLADGKHQKIVTRFPPEPNGYLHIGHVKSIFLNFGLAETFGGECNLRFDDTNPAKEEQEYLDAIKRDIRWLGYQWTGEARNASDYFQQLYDWATHLIKHDKAYVCYLSAEQIREYRGTLTELGRNSPYRDGSLEENLQNFENMRAGHYQAGECVLRAKIDMASPNMNMRDPTLYRILKQSHHQTGSQWCIYPTYDFAHGQADAIEGVTHSICTLEFADHRPLYDWLIENLPVPSRPRQFEFSRLNLAYTVTSKRKLKQLVDEDYVSGWDDPRMPTVVGMRRRGIPATALRKFCEMIGATKSDGMVDIAMLEHAIRDDLDKSAPRAMCVLKPLKVVLCNYPEDKVETMLAPGSPTRDDLPERELPFSREVYIDASDFREQANKKYKRLVLGKRVRLRNAYIIEADHCIKNDRDEIIEVHARIIEGTVGENPQDGIKPKGVIHWVDSRQHTKISINLYDRLFTCEAPDTGEQNFVEHLNPKSQTEVNHCLAEVGLQHAEAEQVYQFERVGYFCRDSKAAELVFNRTIGLRDTFNT
ncbi:MAG: glutaminyl-tRNA synthetase [Cellvibrionaceae bacterium]|jgi:glutaminyl-tRNA synthetase